MSSPAPPLVIVIDCVGGLAAPTAAAKFAVLVESVITVFAEITSVTVTVCGVLLATGDVTETVAEYVPAASPATVACSVSAAGAVVLLSAALSQLLG